MSHKTSLKVLLFMQGTMVICRAQIKATGFTDSKARINPRGKCSGLQTSWIVILIQLAQWTHITLFENLHFSINSFARSKFFRIFQLGLHWFGVFSWCLIAIESFCLLPWDPRYPCFALRLMMKYLFECYSYYFLVTYSTRTTRVWSKSTSWNAE